MSLDYEIVCLDENGGIASTIEGTYSGVDKAVAVAAARAPDHCSRILLCAIGTESVVWQGSREEAIKAAKASRGS